MKKTFFLSFAALLFLGACASRDPFALTVPPAPEWEEVPEQTESLAPDPAQSQESDTEGQDPHDPQDLQDLRGPGPEPASGSPGESDPETLPPLADDAEEIASLPPGSTGPALESPGPSAGETLDEQGMPQSPPLGPAPLEEAVLELEYRKISGEFRTLGQSFPMFARLYWTLRVLEEADLLEEFRAHELLRLADLLFRQVPLQSPQGAYLEARISPYAQEPLILQLQTYGLPEALGRLKPAPRGLIYLLTNLPEQPSGQAESRRTVSMDLPGSARKYLQLIFFDGRPPMDLAWWVSLGPEEFGESDQDLKLAEKLDPLPQAISLPASALSLPDLSSQDSEGLEYAMIYYLRTWQLLDARSLLALLPAEKRAFYQLLLEGHELVGREN